MHKYHVTLHETVAYLVTVEAETEEEVRTIARECWAQSSNPDKDFDGEGYGVKVYRSEPASDDAKLS